MNKKLRKLKKNPKRFFIDMAKKRIPRRKNYHTKTKNGTFQYSVVSAVYNVEKYLDDYFKSLVNQRLFFENNIQLIMVDDGSTDSSSAIINKWQRKYPNNITYLYKENGGQASARNAGIGFVTTEWVTFIDPDDFIDSNYFFEVDKFLAKNMTNNIKMASCNYIFYIEDKNIFKDSHPLKYRFEKGNVTVSLDNMKKHMQLSVNSAFFQTDIIRNEKIEFDQRVKPSFEDGHFTISYLLNAGSGSAAFLQNAKYYYRKRSDASSTLDTSWKKKETFFDVLAYGHLDSLQKTKSSLGYIPSHIQRNILYCLIWYIKHLTNKPERTEFLNSKQEEIFLQLIDKVFSFIEHETIVEFNLAGCWFFDKVGILNCFKKETPNFQIAYIENYDPIKNLVLIRYFTTDDDLEIFSIDNEDTLPAYVKTMQHSFLSRVFCYERKIWLPLKRKSKKITINTSGMNSYITLNNTQHRNGIRVDKIRAHFLKNKSAAYSKNEDLWLLMDRDIQADDNAEHLYRYIKKNHPNQNIAFVLNENSHDWSRLKIEGFNLIAFGTPLHKNALRTCSKIISSHADAYIFNYLQDKSLKHKDFIFLQHGITKDDLSGWLNSKKIDCFITSTKNEYNSIAGNYNNYKFTSKEVVLTGFPRYDSLIQTNDINKRYILIMPTWRNNLVHTGSNKSGKRTLKSDFLDSEFFRFWNSFLQSDTLHNLSGKYGYKIIFFPHANLQSILDQVPIPNYIEVLKHTNVKMQELFKQASLMVTDYSSVAFDFAFLQKPVIYYQFDNEEIFSGSHSYKKGYFDYHRDGFGPVVTEENALLNELEKLLTTKATPEPKYSDRMLNFFPFRDGKNCERTYNAIIALDEPTEARECDISISLSFAQNATRNKKWALAETRWQSVLTYQDNKHTEHANQRLFNALLNQGKLSRCNALLSQLDSSEKVTAMLLMAKYEWAKAAKLWKINCHTDNESLMNYLVCNAELANKEAVDTIISNLIPNEQTNRTQLMAWQAFAYRNWDQVISNLSSTDMPLPDKLLLSRAYRETGVVEKAIEILNTSIADNDEMNSAHYIEFARCAYHQKDWDTAILQLKLAYPGDLTDMPLVDAIMLIQALYKARQYTEAGNMIHEMESLYPMNMKLAVERAMLATEQKKWDQATGLWKDVCLFSKTACYKQAEALRMTGQISESYNILFDPKTRTPKTLDECILRADVAYLSNNYNDAIKEWTYILHIYSDAAPKRAWPCLQTAQLLGMNDRPDIQTNNQSHVNL